MIEESRALCASIIRGLAEIRVSLDIDNCKKRLERLHNQTLEPKFWDNGPQAAKVLKDISNLTETVNEFEVLWDKAQYINDLLAIANDEDEPGLLTDTEQELALLKKRYLEYELQVLFCNEHDEKDAIVSLHAGAGGTEAQDWVEMLVRMYTRWAESSGFSVDILDCLPGDEAGIKSITLIVKGKYAYGKLKCEEGVHRLIRISPFDSSGRRHTSFASLSVMPEISEDIQVNINPDDLRIDTYRSGGAGGQHVNKTDSAVRITHIPTGIVVQCQNERSQISNRMGAMKILAARLYELQRKQHQDSLNQLKGEYKEIAWGSQIRTYTLNPFTLIKDHRTNVEIGDVQAVLDGDLDDLIYACLRKYKNKLPSDSDSK
ncbi:MAG: peptide chain release factor 2 [Syntrophomonadaceae bacterium]